MPQPELDPVLIARAEAAIGHLETALQQVHDAIGAIYAAFVQIYPLDESEEWFAAWGTGRLGALLDRIENVQDGVRTALDMPLQGPLAP